jgi:hypothetical protein
MGIQPTSRPSLGLRPELADVQQGFQSFERKFDTPYKTPLII